MPVHEIDKRQSSAQYDPGIALDRFVVCDGIDAWIAAGRGTGHRSGVASDRIEIDAQLVGCSTRGPRMLGPAMLHHTNPAEPYTIGYDADSGFLGIGITVDPAILGRSEPDADLRVPDTRAGGAELLELFDEMVRRWGDGEPLPLIEAEAVVRRHLARVAELTIDPIARARHLLERYFDRELYLGHIADEVGMTEVQLLRKFQKRYGMTPVRYRNAVRLTRAGRLAWSRPDMTVAEVARGVGIEHIGYFHRSYRAYFGSTPSLHRSNRRPALPVDVGL